MKATDPFYKKLKTYKAKDLHPDCEVVKKKKLVKAVKEIENLIRCYRSDLRLLNHSITRSLKKVFDDVVG